MFDLTDKRAMNKGFGDGMSRAFEFVATPAVFAGIGHLLDRAAGTAPVLTLGLAAFALVGMFVRLWFAYDAEMRQHESAARWAPGALARRSPDAPDTADVDLWAARRRPEAGRPEGAR